MKQTARRAYDSWRLPPNMGSQNSVLAEKKFREVRICDVIKPLTTINPGKQPDVEIEYIDVSSVNRDTLSIQQTSTLLGSEAPSRARRLVHTGDVIFATVRPTLKRITVVPETLDGAVCSTGYFVLRPTDEVLSRYLFYYLQSRRFSKEMESLQRGASYPAVSDKDVKEHIMLLPSLLEQQRIVSILDEAFENIRGYKKQIVQKDNRVRDLLQSSLVSTFSELNVQTKVKIGEFCKTTSGSTPRKSNKDYHTNGTIPWLLSGEVNTKEITESKNFITELALKETSVKLFPPDSVLIAMYGATAGQVGILRFHSTTNQAICGIFPNDKIFPEYLFYALQNANAELVAQASGSAQPNLSQQKIKALSIPLPPLKEQSEIIQKFDSLFENVNQIEQTYQQELNSYDELKQSILQEAFSGTL